VSEDQCGLNTISSLQTGNCVLTPQKAGYLFNGYQ